MTIVLGGIGAICGPFSLVHLIGGTIGLIAALALSAAGLALTGLLLATSR